MTFIPKRSSTLLGGGIIALVIGQVVYSNGRSASIEDALRTYSSGDDGSTAIALGLVLTVVGLITLVCGVMNLARSVDYLAQREHARSVIDASTPIPDGISAEARAAAARGRAIIDGTD